MKSNLTKVSVALLSTAFLLACQDQGPGPVGPEGLKPQFDKPTCGGQHCNHGGDPDPDPDPLFTLDLAGGMQVMDLLVGDKETTKTLGIGNHNEEKKSIQMAFTDDNMCEGVVVTNRNGTVPVRNDGVFERLLAQLTKLVPGGQLRMTIHKPGLVLGDSTTADGHGVLVDYEDGNDVDLGFITIGLGGPHNPAAQVKWTENGSGEDVYTFSGSILVWAGFSGGNQNSQVINCPKQEVVVTLHR